MTCRCPGFAGDEEPAMSLLCRLSTGLLANLCVPQGAWERNSAEH